MNNKTTPKVKVKGHAAYMVVFDWSVDVRFLILPLVKCGNENCSKLLMIRFSLSHRSQKRYIMLGNFSQFFLVCGSFFKSNFSKKSFRNTIRVSKSLDPDHCLA